MQTRGVLDSMRRLAEDRSEGGGSTGSVLLRTCKHCLFLLGCLLTNVGIGSDGLDGLGRRLVDDWRSVTRGSRRRVGIGSGNVVRVAQCRL